MISKSNFRDVLLSLGFEEFEMGMFRKSWPEHEIGCEMLAYLPTDDKPLGKLVYPTGVEAANGTTSNFSHDENFVVFECVARLLDKGYHPDHIELEPTWPLGREGKSGRADIWIRTLDKKDKTKKHSLCIIECKTAGHEFDASWEYTKEDGYQLFSYFNQETETKFLCLYASDWNADKGEVEFDYRLINVQDNEEHLSNIAKHKKVPTYKNATNTKQRFAAWKETYSLDSATKGLFEQEIQPYEIGKKKYTIADLRSPKDNTTIQKKYHEFATILRQHNVSGRENAFDKLVNLFLAKVVDETNNPNELRFYWKGAAYDDDFRLQDRLQQLYSVGMDKFLGEKVTYINEDTVEEAFKLFKKKPDETKDTIRGIIHELKFFSNNDFAFIDVHNEHLFYQNAAILRKIVMMLQDMQLRSPDQQHQFLGDLFEGFLDQGVKQSEGQFFTPMPYVKFMVSSLPIAWLIETMKEPPKMIDYACGAGHFMTEYSSQIRRFVDVKNATLPSKQRKNYADYFAAVTGIEKEYRLSKVTKVAAFMYGQDEIKVVYGDALADLSRHGIKDGVYNVLIANPPYSVKGFFETLTDAERDQYRLGGEIDAKSAHKSNAIETFFIERAAQFLAPGGIAAIILPVSVLSKGGIYQSAREIILESFDIVAIAEMGSGTFGKTGTNTATFFLRRKASKPNYANHARNRVDAWFKGDFSGDEIFDDGDVLKRYAECIGVSVAEYKTLLKGKPCAALLECEQFKNYVEAFSKETKAKKKKDDDLKQYVLSRICEVEKYKLRIFMLAENNPQDVLVVKSPSESKNIKKFLGYEWSIRKGGEGIKYVGVADSGDEDVENSISLNRGISQIQTPLFNPKDYDDQTKINALIRKNFLCKAVVVPDSLDPFVKAMPLSSMIDFKKVAFNLEFSSSRMEMPILESKFPLSKLGGDRGVCDVRIGGTPDTNNASYYGGKHLWVSVAELNGNLITATAKTLTDAGVEKSNVKLIPKGTTLLSFKLSIGKTAIAGADLYTNEAIAALVPKDPNMLLDKYLFYFFSGRVIDISLLKGDNAIGKSLNSTMLKNEVKIPVPPLDVQKKIVAECEKVDKKYSKVRMSIEDYKVKINAIFSSLGAIKGG